ncbi:MAG: hypothetical protein Q7S74_00565 [Nanoarchaeota archaeon]|nr:hypothetical protein [Nanoarchaeota archaeon]
MATAKKASNEDKEGIKVTNPSKEGVPSWVKMKQADLEKIVVELAKKGETPAKIGLILRDKHGIPKARLLGKKVTKILRDAGVDFKTEEDIIKERVEKLRVHLSKHKHNHTAARSLTKKLWVLSKAERT